MIIYLNLFVYQGTRSREIVNSVYCIHSNYEYKIILNLACTMVVITQQWHIRFFFLGGGFIKKKFTSHFVLFSNY